MGPTFYLLDTFTDTRFSGNPTPVCIAGRKLSAETMYSLTKEFNAPVTAFIEPSHDSNVYNIRYFTVTGEISACGHATLGAAFVVLSQTDNNEIVFQTLDATQVHSRKEEDLVLLNYPKYEPGSFEVPSAMISALGTMEMKSHFYCAELQSLFIELNSENAVKQLSPDFRLLRECSDKVKEVVVMSKAESHTYDFILRSFCPWIGIDEDPVTGSIHSVLGPFWQKRLGKKKLIAYQASERGGLVFIQPFESTVEIGGHVQVIAEGRLHV